MNKFRSGKRTNFKRYNNDLNNEWGTVLQSIIMYQLQNKIFCFLYKIIIGLRQKKYTGIKLFLFLFIINDINYNHIHIFDQNKYRDSTRHSKILFQIISIYGIHC